MQPKKSERKKATAAKKTPSKQAGLLVGGARKAAPRKGAKKSATKTAKKAVRKAAKKAPTAAWTSLSSSSASERVGSVYIIGQSGGKKVRTHVAKKASGHEIRESLGISQSRLTRVRGMLKTLEKKGKISKA